MCTRPLRGTGELSTRLYSKQQRSSKSNLNSLGLSNCGYVFMLAGGAISYSSKLQSIVTLSTCVTEYVAMCQAGKEAVC